jgi:hypothetical protein
MDKQTIVSNLKNKVEDEMSKAGVYSKGIDGMIAANDFKNSLGEEKNKKTDANVVFIKLNDFWIHCVFAGQIDLVDGGVCAFYKLGAEVGDDFL